MTARHRRSRRATYILAGLGILAIGTWAVALSGITASPSANTVIAGPVRTVTATPTPAHHHHRATIAPVVVIAPPAPAPAPPPHHPRARHTTAPTSSPPVSTSATHSSS